ncbi:MAG: hypothetical protein ACI92E_000345 [Oceanicoccus sp.]|jgi:hypothetical protein
MPSSVDRLNKPRKSRAVSHHFESSNRWLNVGRHGIVSFFNVSHTMLSRSVFP